MHHRSGKVAYYSVSPAVFLALSSLFLLTVFVEETQAHAFISKPLARSGCPSCNNYCPQCLSAGGPGVVQGLSPGNIFPATETPATSIRHGLCGEPAANPNQRYLTPGPVVETWQAGTEVDVSVTVTAHHRGHFEFRLCERASDLTQACLNENVLKIAYAPGDATDPAHPERWYLPNRGPAVYDMRLRVPANLKCDNCVLQFYYVTANSCNPPGYADVNWPASDWWQSNLPLCSTAYPEEFWNCADVAVRSDGPNPQTTTTIATTASSSSGTTTTAEIPPRTTTATDSPPATTTVATTVGPSGGDMCTGCFHLSSGHCKSASGACYDYIPGTTNCWAGTFKCSNGGGDDGGDSTAKPSATTTTAESSTTPTPTTTTKPSTTTIKAESSTTTTKPITTTTTAKADDIVMCTGCFHPSSGPCKAASGACYSFIPGTESCWAGTAKCSDTVGISADRRRRREVSKTMARVLRRRAASKVPADGI